MKKLVGLAMTMVFGLVLVGCDQEAQVERAQEEVIEERQETREAEDPEERVEERQETLEAERELQQEQRELEEERLEETTPNSDL